MGTNSTDPSVWKRIEDDILTRRQPAQSFDIWKLAEERLNPAKYRPIRITDAELAEVTGRAGAKRFMLRNPDNNKYVTLGEEELFLWNLMDGQNTVKDLVLEYFSKYGSMGQEVLLNLLGLLKSNGFFRQKPAPVMQSLMVRLQGKKLVAWLMSAVSFFMHRTFTSKRVDGYFDWLYRHVARPMYTRPGLIIILFLLTTDLVLFSYFFFVQHISLLISHRGASIHDLISIMLISYGSICLHEHAHGLTVKHYGRKVLRAGVMLYFGSPIAFVDTTDIWMKPRNPRMAVSFAGPCCNAVIGCFLFLTALFLPDSTVRSILIQGGILNTILFIANLLPIAETDGHYIIQDYLEMPRLRPQSLSFIGRGMWQKLARHEHWAKDDFIRLLYGLAAVAGAGLLLYIGVHLWFTMGARLVGTLLSRPLLLAEIFAVLMAITATVAVLRGGLRWLRPRVSVESALENHIQGS